MLFNVRYLQVSPRLGYIHHSTGVPFYDEDFCSQLKKDLSLQPPFISTVLDKNPYYNRNIHNTSRHTIPFCYY